MKNAADSVKSISMELGGNAPFIVFGDCDIDKAIEGLVAAKFRNAGQSCISANRVFVQKNILKSFYTKLKIRLGELKVGDGFKGSDIGPLISEKAVTKVKKNINDAIKKGAKLYLGGNRYRTEK